MTDRDTMEQLAALFRETAEAHQAAFAACDGEDPEWPLWYAAHLQARLNALLGNDLTKSEIVWGLVSAENERQEEEDDDWSMFYADFFDDTFQE